MFIKTYNQKGESVGEIELPSDIFGVEMNTDVVHQVLVSQTSNRRKTIAHTKNRGEVSGGGKKPWRQKGTGRSRHGSIRSPIWKGGGVVFGPRKEKGFKKKINKKMNRKAILMVLSSKAKDNELIVLDNLKIEKPKTKIIKEALNNLKIKGSFLLTIPQKDDNVIRSVRNISGSKVLTASSLNVLDLLSSKYLIMPKDSINAIKASFIK